MALEAGDHIVDNALLSLPREGKDAYLARLVESFDGNRHVRVALMEGGRAARRFASRAARSRCRAGSAACWKFRGSSGIDYAPAAGRARCWSSATDPHNEISEAWVQFRDGPRSWACSACWCWDCCTGDGALSRRRCRGWARVSMRWAAAIMPRGVAAKGPREIFALARPSTAWPSGWAMLEDANRAPDRPDAGHPGRGAGRTGARPARRDGAVPVRHAGGCRGHRGEARKAGQGAIAARARAIGEAVSHIQSHVRLILKQLRPDGLAEIGLAQAIANLGHVLAAPSWRHRHCAGDRCGAQGFGAETDAAIYRLVQEGLTNAARHGGAQHVWIAISAAADAIHVAGGG